MPDRYEPLPIAPEVLEWARTSAGLTEEEVAARLGLSSNYVLGLEAGTSDVSWAQLRKLAAIYRRPISVLLRTEAPKELGFPTDFRTVGGGPARKTRAVLTALRRATRIQEAVSSLPEEYLPDVNLPRATSSENADGVARVVRHGFGIAADAPLAWPNSNSAFNHWRGFAQGAGVLVLVERMPREECRGFALWNPPNLPCIVITNDEADEARSFTLWHEFAHLLLRSSAACLERHETRDPSGLAREEAWCNRVAASVLAPEESILAAFRSVPGLPSPAAWGLSEVTTIARRLKVSRHVIALKLEDIGFKQPGFYRSLLPSLVGDDRRPLRSDDDDIRIPTQRRAASELGFLTILPILRAVQEGETGAADAASVLGVPAGRLRAVREEAERLQASFARQQ